ncbi:psbP domain-containing protein 2, chloroplastic-like isoform X2 [Nicotiana tabacum]|uniref:PsbP domain-containing protein 2, chloroplastic-like isoform X2 n=1 Tax=Nicotiana tabacum TaxID=4097 RepID=A0A1S3YJG0_TOBAC|nr:PREDICTED: psbP domain-containing protein 2, chloroplastic-like isoform X2 [Nicotiana tabacum]
MSTLSSVTRSIAYNGFFQNLIMTMPITPPQIIKRKRSLTVSSLSIPHNNETNKSMAEMVPIVSNRRVLNLSILTVLLWDPFSTFSVAIGGEVLELERYTDSTEGFTLLRPSSWIKDANKGSNNVGVVVIPVKIATLSQFGTPQFVADKLILAEKRKESTKEAEVVAVSERTGEGGLQVYEFEYKIDSTRGGMKRILSAAFVASGKLYLLNIAHSDGLESPIDPDRRNTLEQILHSFDTAPST